MKKIAIALGALLLVNVAHAAPPVAKPPAFDRSVLHVQVILDKLGFAPGVLDGKGGKSLVAALKGFQTANNLAVTGEADTATLKAMYPYRNWRPTVTVPVTADWLAGPFVNPLPKDPLDQAKLPSIGYRNALEALSERFHTTMDTIIQLNPPGTRLAVGTRIVFPNAVPVSRAYDVKDATWLATLQSLNVGAIQPKAKRIVVDKSESVLKVYDENDKLVAQFPATMGSTHDPLPIGKWTIKGISYNPKFHYNSKLFWDAENKDEKALLPPGPNGPVGVVWIDLSKPHYGIHGTPSPETISRAESHGCIRLTNWDAARLALMVKTGVPAVFQP